MALNLELKAQVHSMERAHAAARACGAAFQGILRQVDTYFMVSHGRLKLREINEDEAELIFYERPEETAERWSTYYKEHIDNAGAIKQMLAGALGVRVVVKKQRHLYLLRDIRIHLDEVDGLGTFLEFEVPVHGEEEARAQMAQMRKTFAIADVDIFRESYSDLILANRPKKGS